MKNGYILKVKRIAKSNWKTNFNINEFPCHLPILVGIFFFHYQLQEQKKKEKKEQLPACLVPSLPTVETAGF